MTYKAIFFEATMGLRVWKGLNGYNQIEGSCKLPKIEHLGRKFTPKKTNCQYCVTVEPLILENIYNNTTVILLVVITPRSVLCRNHWLKYKDLYKKIIIIFFLIYINSEIYQLISL